MKAEFILWVWTVSLYCLDHFPTTLHTCHKYGEYNDNDHAHAYYKNVSRKEN